jgi:hypothetical protein
LDGTGCGEGYLRNLLEAGLPNPPQAARLFVRHRPSFANELRLAQWRTPIDLHQILFAIKHAQAAYLSDHSRFT